MYLIFIPILGMSPNKVVEVSPSKVARPSPDRYDFEENSMYFDFIISCSSLVEMSLNNNVDR